jgi:hypothetical protein
MNQIKLNVTFTVSVSDNLLSSLNDEDSVTEFVINNCFKNNARIVHQITFGDMYKIDYKENK